MKKQAPFKLLAFDSVLLIVMVGFIYEMKKTIDTPKKYITSKEKSDQEKAEAYVEEMKPKVEEELRKKDIHHFIKSVTFEDKATINPMGRIIVNGYINDNPDKFYFSSDLIYDSNKVDGMSYSEDVGNRFTDWSEYSKEVKDKYIKTAYPDKKEQEQYLKDIGE
ncbi:DUF1433 domain-containing protein [Bacillus vallismortis]|uniref:DUF1433 domain-containing protein n=1 Tax=Bacillus vallismortis TaxID=72361 RepID=UPI0022823843|nr:DUF1433 domain-containing protein [Bacillus vallismortis]MCY8307761.1 DUF1433 domain-containing protein [Bacillus vallismortis]MCY8598403.1 DUF1433 domain-containing protein [Bacillus vallismortis]